VCGIHIYNIFQQQGLSSGVTININREYELILYKITCIESKISFLHIRFIFHAIFWNDVLFKAMLVNICVSLAIKYFLFTIL